MALKLSWIVALGFPLVLIGGTATVGLAVDAEQKAQPPAQVEKAKPEAPAASQKPAAAARPAGLVGKVVAVTPQSQTIVVDVPLGKETLRLGAETTDETKIMVDGKTASLDALKAGGRVRISYHRTTTGDVADTVVALPATQG